MAGTARAGGRDGRRGAAKRAPGACGLRRSAPPGSVSTDDGRSPDSRVAARPILPGPGPFGLSASGCVRGRSPLTVAGAVADSAPEDPTAFPFRRRPATEARRRTVIAREVARDAPRGQARSVRRGAGAGRPARLTAPRWKRLLRGRRFRPSGVRRAAEREVGAGRSIQGGPQPRRPRDRERRAGPHDATGAPSASGRRGARDDPRAGRPASRRLDRPPGGWPGKGENR